MPKDSNVSVSSTYKRAPDVRGGDAAHADAARGQYAAAAEALFAAFREARLRAAPQVAVRSLEAPCLPPEQPSAAVTAAEALALALASPRAVAIDLAAVVAARLAESAAPLSQRLADAVENYRGRLALSDAASWARTTLALGDALAALGEFHAAALHCYSACLLQPEPRAGAPVALADADALGAHCRALLGLAAASAGVARLRDPRLESAGTLAQLLLCLQRAQQAVQLVVSARPRAVRERLYFVVFNGAATVLHIAEPLITFDAAFARRVLPFVAFCVLAVEATPHLATPQHLPLRVRLYGAACRAYERLGLLPVGALLAAPGTAAGAAAPAKGAPPAAAPAGGAGADGLPAPEDEGVLRAGTVGHTQASAEVMRIGDAVEQQEQWRSFDRVEQFVKIARQRELADARDHALMAAGADHRVESLVVGLDDAHIGSLGRA